MDDDLSLPLFDFSTGIDQSENRGQEIPFSSPYL